MILKHEFRGYFGGALTKPPFGVTSAEILCPGHIYTIVVKLPGASDFVKTCQNIIPPKKLTTFAKLNFSEAALEPPLLPNLTMAWKNHAEIQGVLQVRQIPGEFQQKWLVVNVG